MFWKLLWCTALACGSGQMESEAIGAKTYTRDQCVAEANSRLEREPNKLFTCLRFDPASERRYWDQWSAGEKPEARTEEVVLIGPRTLSY